MPVLNVYYLLMVWVKKYVSILVVFVCAPHAACAHESLLCVHVCLQCKLKFNLLGEVSIQSGQYHLLPQSQMEAGWGAENQSSPESSHHYRAERGNKAKSWEITAAAASVQTPCFLVCE